MIRETTSLPDLIKYTFDIYHDDRGSFKETYNSFVSQFMHKITFCQDNESFSKKGVLRGLHFQAKPFEQGKLVRVITGKVQDIAVDLRPESITYKKYYSIILNNTNMLYIPPGFAHGFLTLEDSIFSYKCTAPYEPNSQKGICWNDSELNITWMLSNPILSKKDQLLPTLQKIENVQ